jgi:hypothetical protein
MNNHLVSEELHVEKHLNNNHNPILSEEEELEEGYHEHVRDIEYVAILSAN